MSRNLAIVGASYLQLPLIEKAKELGYTTHVFAWAANDVGEKAADYFYPISIRELDEITTVCKKIGIVGICSIASDLASITVNYVADKLGLVGNSLESTNKSTNKHLMRLAFEQNGDPSPKSVLVDDYTDYSTLDMRFPVIVKPTDRSGSRGIYKVDSMADLENAIKAAKSQGFEKKVLIEEFVEGQEYSVEGVSFRGKHKILAMTYKKTTGAPYFIETGHFEPAPVDSNTYKRVENIITHALDSLGLENGASHSEIKIDTDGSIKIIEIGGRMGGDCIGSDLVYYSTGIDYVKAIIQVSCGEEPDLSQKFKGYPVSSHFIFNEEDAIKMDEIMRNEPESFLRLVYLNRDLFNKATNSSDRAGCYILKHKNLNVESIFTK